MFWEDKAANLQMLEQKIEGITEKTEVVVLPEMFSTGFTMNPAPFAETMDGPTVAWMRRIAMKKGVIVTGSLIIASPPNSLSSQREGDENVTLSLPKGHIFYNRLIWMLPNGEFGYYDKRHLFAFAGENEHYAAGNKRLIASVKGWKINLQVCYDLRFPVWARQSPPLSSGERGPGGEVEYDILINVANWPQRRNHAWKTLLQARAIENQCYVVGVNRVGEDGNSIYHAGDSMVVDPLGEVLYHKENEEDVFTITLQKEVLDTVRNKFPFLRDGDGFGIF